MKGLDCLHLELHAHWHTQIREVELRLERGAREGVALSGGVSIATTARGKTHATARRIERAGELVGVRRVGGSAGRQRLATERLTGLCAFRQTDQETATRFERDIPICKRK
jgi:hypothetical protein